MTATESLVQWREAKFGAKRVAAFLGTLMDDDFDDYPLDGLKDAGGGPVKPVTTRAPVDLVEDLEFIVGLMNAFDKAQGLKPTKKWKMSNVALLALRGLHARWCRNLGGSLPAKEDRAEYLRHAKKHFETMRANRLVAKKK